MYSVIQFSVFPTVHNLCQHYFYPWSRLLLENIAVCQQFKRFTSFMRPKIPSISCSRQPPTRLHLQPDKYTQNLHNIFVYGPFVTIPHKCFHFASDIVSSRNTNFISTRNNCIFKWWYILEKLIYFGIFVEDCFLCLCFSSSSEM
jgi:hypothetical protein